MRNIVICNSELFSNDALNLYHNLKHGSIENANLGLTLNNAKDDIEVLDLFSSSNFESTKRFSPEEPINISSEKINSLNIIINDSNCRENFINRICEELEKYGINFSFTNHSKNIDVDNAVVITLDQQYVAGPATIVFAPLENNRLGNSDALALAAESSLYENGILVDGIACGQMGFRENKNGTISERVPTETENNIGADKDTSFVTISFGTQNNHVEQVASCIKGMLIRYYSYITSEYKKEDLIYCVEDGQDYDDVAKMLDSPSTVLYSFNNLSNENILLSGDALVNPCVEDIKEFNKQVSTNLCINKTL